MGVPGRAASCAGKVFGLISTELENKTHSVPRAHAEGPGGVGPVSPDTVFRQFLGRQNDSRPAKYGDQGHIAIRTAGFFEHRAGRRAVLRPRHGGARDGL
ncbi:TPA: 4-hydroxythreonine-4-phosphate dehydrogenase PdxA [Burkholderia vietnamiensis]|nr:4-hydroxythreonine-4-phosphate dehydrogenase PdxA [Burkholderia vietnamiensis]HDR9319232.1 4-hydroxythreonine-4-phosphate dehydrogenase PdxA [Burkholderia vietnamiensis]